MTPILLPTVDDTLRDVDCHLFLNSMTAIGDWRVGLTSDYPMALQRHGGRTRHPTWRSFPMASEREAKELHEKLVSRGMLVSRLSEPSGDAVYIYRD